MPRLTRTFLCLIWPLPLCALVAGCASELLSTVDVAEGWANNSVNAVAFRKNSLVTHGDTQYIAFYDQQRRVVLGKRALGTGSWQLQLMPYSGNAADAHNSISIMVDGAGFLHMAWDHHNGALRYVRALAPGALALGAPMPMTGADETAVSYPEFHRLPDGDLLFCYRNGASGRGDLVINRYDVASGAWTRLHSDLVSGEGQRNAYWQSVVDRHGTVHLSWVWRESPDVASNHDMAYARSRDGGRTWERSNGQPYRLPITAASAEYAARIAQNSELINQTSMAADSQGNPYIASYWRQAGSLVPQYQVLYQRGGAWQRLALDFRSTPFSLSGQGTKAIPIARPQILIDPLPGAGAGRPAGLLVFRDQERGSKVSVVTIADFDAGRWAVRDLGQASVGAWEPSFDTELWRRDGELDLFVQDVRQADAEGSADGAPSMVRVLQWKPRRAAPLRKD
ncbi:MAG: BNR repeat-containing protein [Pseudomonadota bacterium]|nr:BNR repeat-containing protein [Pseudomonadota bacterium]